MEVHSLPLNVAVEMLDPKLLPPTTGNRYALGNE